VGLGSAGALPIGGGVERAGEPAQQVTELERVEAPELIEPLRAGTREPPLRPAQLDALTPPPRGQRLAGHRVVR
jgi:hypothetical protein